MIHDSLLNHTFYSTKLAVNGTQQLFKFSVQHIFTVSMRNNAYSGSV